ncbi:hypothetical protein HGP28_00300 [Vibrio sp. SM6]|uniref:54K polar flagellar sheath protein A n=1 Tax=Vibrio agarilyticus TaxID=2726741 RepID=A0A7X8TMK0_9VIBR|nr:hypothetical protein [Vibrio agarilyticus]NLS11324.1 hypothetical protein [Vibrio agarilyticus]
MKNLTLLPLAVLISTALAGCGGSSGGGGTPAPTKTAINLSFVKAEMQSLVAAANCKIYERERTEITNGDETDVETDVLTVKPVGDALDSFIYINFSDETGEVIDGSELALNDGRIGFFLEDVPTNGFVNVVEHVNFNYYATSFSRAFLEANSSLFKNMTLTVVNPVGNAQCVTATNNLAEVNKTGVEYALDPEGSFDDVGIFPYYFTSNIETEAGGNSPEITAKTDFQALGNDITAITQYRDGDKESLVQYGYEDWASGKVNMVYTGEKEPIIRSQSNVIYDDVDVGVVYRDSAKVLTHISSKTEEYYRPLEKKSAETWFVSAVGIPAESWSATLNFALDDTWNASLDEGDLFDVASLANASALYSNQSNGALVIDMQNSITIGTSDFGLQRISLHPDAGSDGLSLHTIYSLPTQKLVVPMVEDFDSVDLTAAKLKQDYWFSETTTALDPRLFMDQFDSSDRPSPETDSHGLILEEGQRFQLNAAHHKTRSFALSREQ